MSRPAVGQQVHAPIPRRNVNQDLFLQYRPNEGLAIHARSRQTFGSVRKVLLAPEELGAIDDSDLLILRVAKKTGPEAPGEGFLWTSVDMAVHFEQGQAVLAVDLELRWNESASVSRDLHGVALQELRLIVATFFPAVLDDPRLLGNGEQHGSPQDFYEAAHVPSRDGPDEADPLYVPQLTARLFPFQRRAVRWLLQREGVQWTSNTGSGESGVVPYHEEPSEKAVSHFVCAQDADGKPCYISDLFGVVTRDTSVFEERERALRGGILSEEMGLGKTVEMISLILLHRREPAADVVQDRPLLRPTGATLIVTPPALRSQWISELNRHAPDLRVVEYEGMARSCPDEESEAAMVEQLATCDVVITTYSDLRSELYFAVDPPERKLRTPRQRPRPRSPLVQLEWWRVCLDEAQEIESGVSGAAEVLRVIPRINAWGVTGTPVKDGIQDLWGLLVFLRYQPYGFLSKLWKNLVKAHRDVFQNLFSRISMRHTKRVVGDELTIPPQKRYVIKMPFTAVEEQHYQTLFRQLTATCGLSPQGVPLRDGWDPTSSAVLEAMRSALNRLRQTALHPEIGEQNRQALGHRAGPMRTLAEVLDAMIEQSESSLLLDHRALLAHKLKHGQLLENSPRVREALAIWKDVLHESESLVQDARDKLKVQLEKAKEAGEDGLAEAKSKKKGRDDETDSEDDTDMDGEGPDKTKSGHVKDAQRELRYALEIQHRAEFFCANAYFQIKSDQETTPPDSDEFRRLEGLETAGYEQAKHIRQEILHENRSRAMRQMGELEAKASTQSFVTIPECTFAAPNGIEGRRIAEDLEDLGVLLDRQAEQMDDWREAVVQLLLKDLVDEEEENEAGKEITGDEYENSTKVQDEIQAYLTILKAGISDRQAALTGIAPSGLAVYEEQTALRMAKDGEGPAPELMLRLFRERQAVQPGRRDEESGEGQERQESSEELLKQKKKQAPQQLQKSLRAAVVELRDLAARLKSQSSSSGMTGPTAQRADAELANVQEQLRRTQEQQTQQLKVVAGLEKETRRVASALNSRIAYYRQLQVVSDMVAPYEGIKDEAAIAALGREEHEMAEALATAEAKHRYLIHLKEADKDEAPLCVICQSTFSIGVLTVCGHRFCKDCITMWFQAHHNCPMCKRPLRASNLHDIVLKSQELQVVSESGPSREAEGTAGPEDAAGPPDHPVGGPEGQSQRDELGRVSRPRDSIYANFRADQLDMDLPGPYFTTKVDTLVRHLLWLRISDPGAKSIIFSQFPDFLAILAQAFRQHNIGFSRYVDRNGIARFREDPGIECFLLHARAHSSGLNLVHASHVILCEPLLNTALELQAIARVHRIGQQHETTVWLYIVNGTVEESIYNLSVQRRMEHAGRTQPRPTLGTATPPVDLAASSRALDLADSLELQQAQLSKLMGKGKMAGEEVAQGDLWTCLFSNAPRPVQEDDEQLRNEPMIRRHLLASAAEERQV